MLIQAEARTDVRLHVLIEVKTMKDYHLVFGMAPSQHEAKEQFGWIGLERNRLRECLTAEGVTAESIARLMAHFDDEAYPKGTYRVHGSLVGPPHAGFVMTSAYRETNVGGEKEYGASVLWKALRGLDDARAGEIERQYEVFLSNVRSHVEAARTNGYDCEPGVLQEISSSVRWATLLHPVVIVDARLWLSTESTLKEVDRVRFVLRVPNERDRWFDVVNRTAFPAWLAELEAHYSKSLETAEARRARENAQWLNELIEGLLDPQLEVEVKVRNRRPPSRTRKFVLTRDDLRGRKSRTHE
jgi:hypothetical protein